MIVGMRVESFNPITSTTTHTNSCYFTMAAKNEDGTLKEVQGLILQSEQEIIRFCEGQLIKKLSKEKRDVLKGDLGHLTLEDMIQQCEMGKCTISI
jgi:acyl-CoA hydrolase